MKIAVVTQWFPPEPGTVVASAIVDGLANRGHQVDVLTGFPNYPTGTLSEGYSLRPYRRERRTANVRVHRAPLYPSHNRSAIQRCANYLSFAIASWCVSQIKLDRPDAWIIYSSPATAAIPALLSRRGMKAPTYLLIQDLWPDSVTESGFLAARVSEPVDWLLSRYCDWTYRRASGVGVISPGMRSILVSRGVPPQKIHSTPNWVPEPVESAPVRDDLRRELGLPAGRLFMYAGNLGNLQGLDLLVRAFCRVPEAQLVLIGRGVQQAALVELAGTAKNVTFVEPQPSERIGTFVAASDVQVVSLQDTPLLRATMPSKVQNSMAAGRPILAHASGDVADLVTESGSGIACQPGDERSTVRAIRDLLESSDAELKTMGRNAHATYRALFSPEAGVDRLEAMLSQSAVMSGCDS